MAMVRADLIDLMARLLVALSGRSGNVDDRAFWFCYRPEDQAGATP